MNKKTQQIIKERYRPEQRDGAYYVHDCLFPEPGRGMRAFPYETEDGCQTKCDSLNEQTPDFVLAPELRRETQEKAA